MATKPGSYDDLEKLAGDFLDDKKTYKFSRNLQVVSKTANGVTFTFDGQLSQAGAKSSMLSKLAAKFKPGGGVVIKKLQTTSAGRFIGEASIEDLLDGLTVNVNVEDGAGDAAKNFGKVGADYEGSAGDIGFNLSAECDVSNGPTVDASALLGYDGILVGGSATIDTGVDAGTGVAVTSYEAALGYREANFQTALKL